MQSLRCKPGDLAIIVKAYNRCNIGTIVQVIRRDDGQHPLSFSSYIPCWLVTSAKRLTWTKNGKKVCRFVGPAPDDQLQPIRGLPPCQKTAKTFVAMIDKFERKQELVSTDLE
jgi:hypothetical protein